MAYGKSIIIIIIIIIIINIIIIGICHRLLFAPAMSDALKWEQHATACARRGGRSSTPRISTYACPDFASA